MRVNIRASLYCLVGFRNMFASTPWRTLGGTCSRHNDTSSVSEGCSLTVSMFWQALRRTQHHWNRRWMSVRFHGQRSLCRCLLLAVLHTNSWKHPHHWRTCPRTRQRSCFAEVLSSILQFLVLVTRSEVLHDGSIDIATIHCPRGPVLTHVASLNYSFAPSHGLFRGCECTMSVHSRTVNVLWNKRLSIFLHKCRFPSCILSFGIQLCFRLAESSAQSSSQSEDDDAEFIQIHVSDRRRWQDGGSAVS